MILPLEQQVTNLEISKKLKALNCKQESLWWWVMYSSQAGGNGNRFIVSDAVLDSDRSDYIYPISAYTVSELGELLPDWFYTMRLDGDREYCCVDEDAEVDKYGIKLDKNGGSYPECLADTEATARGKMLIHLLEGRMK